MRKCFYKITWLEQQILNKMEHASLGYRSDFDAGYMLENVGGECMGYLAEPIKEITNLKKIPVALY